MEIKAYIWHVTWWKRCGGSGKRPKLGDQNRRGTTFAKEEMKVLLHRLRPDIWLIIAAD
jgi:hypothetical protein